MCWNRRSDLIQNNRRINNSNGMMSRNTYTMVFMGLLLTALLFHFGDLQGISSVQKAEAPNHVLFFALVLPVQIGIMAWFGYLRHLQVFFRFRVGLSLFVLTALLVSLGRDDAASQVRNALNIMLSYMVILGFCAMAYAIDFRKVMQLVAVFVVFVFLPATAFTHLTKVGPLVLFPDRTTDNMLRFGGMLYYAHTAMVLGVGGLFALWLLLTSDALKDKIWYGFLFLIANVFLVYTDCRSAWGGVGLSYILLAFPYLSLRAKYIIAGCVILLLPAGLLGKSLLAKKVATNYNTESDFQFRMRIWQYAIRGIERQPITGYGSKSFLESDHKATTDLDEELNDPHSATIGLALQSGLLVVLIFYVLFGQMAVLCYKHALGAYWSMLSLCVFWFFVPFFWGNVYNGAGGFVQLFFPISYFIGLLHPDLYRSREQPADLIKTVVPKSQPNAYNYA